MKVVYDTAKLMPFRDLKPGDTFLICGDLAIKTTDGKAVVLSDGNYVEIGETDNVKRVNATACT